MEGIHYLLGQIHINVCFKMLKNSPLNLAFKKCDSKNFPSGCQGGKTLPSNSGGTSWIPGWGTQVSHAAGWGQKLKTNKQTHLTLYCYYTQG